MTFLALLELIKRFHVAAHQEGIFSDIQIELIGELGDTEDFAIEFGE